MRFSIDLISQIILIHNKFGTFTKHTFWLVGLSMLFSMYLINIYNYYKTEYRDLIIVYI